ncbi:MAG: hypothetical protein EA345_05810 [Halomonas sp.]|nr:hypothetical protein [Halomonas sp.]TVP50046.1 MAG: hypothetical protein EA345_05810 [Halomonas sp.]
MHQHIEWDDPGSASVMQLFKKDHHYHPTPGPGDILSARYKLANVRVKVAAYIEKDAVSIGEVVAIIDVHGRRHNSHHKLELGSMVRLPDDKRALEAHQEKEDEEESEKD